MPLVIQNVYPQVIKTAKIQRTLIKYLMNTVKIYIAIHLGLNQIDVLEVVILLITCLIRHVF